MRYMVVVRAFAPRVEGILNVSFENKTSSAGLLIVFQPRARFALAPT